MGAVTGEIDSLIAQLQSERGSTAHPRGALARQWEADIKISGELVRALAGVLDIREVFPEISRIVGAALPHDRLTMTFHDGQGNFEMHAASNADGPTAMRATRLSPGPLKAGTFKIVDDLLTYARLGSSLGPTEDVDLAEVVADARADLGLVVAERSALTMHASALAARPAVVYFRGATIDGYHVIAALRKSSIPAWFTCDAGPHPKALTDAANAERVANELSQIPGVLRTRICAPGPNVRIVE